MRALGSEKRRDRQQQDERRERQHDVDAGRDHAVGRAPVVAGDQAEDAAEEQPEHDGRAGDGERQPGAVDAAGEDVVADLVRAEPVRGRAAAA